MSNVFAALLLTSMTGTVFFIFGSIIRRIWFPDDVGWQRAFIKTVLVSYCVPAVYLVMYAVRGFHIVKDTDSVFQKEIHLFYNTPGTRPAAAAGGCIWAAMFLVLLLYRVYRRLRWVQACRGNIPEEDAVVQEVFDAVCGELGISGEVGLYRNDLIRVPCVTYYHGPIVILPLNYYDRQEAYIILFHELCHCVGRDVPLKTFGILVNLLHVFNPAAHIILKQIDLLCEESCDRLACEKGKEAYSEREYFQKIFDMLLTDGERDRYQLFALVDTRLNYERRVLSMKKYRERRGVKRWAAVVLSAVFLLGSSMTALAAGNGMAAAYDRIALGTKEGSAEDVDYQLVQEIIKENNLDPNKVIIVDSGISLCSEDPAVFNVNWTVPAGYTVMTTSFEKLEGETVAVTLKVTPEDVTIETGIKNPDDTVRYVQGEKEIFHSFEIKKKGRYCFYVYNPSETTDVDVLGSVL